MDETLTKLDEGELPLLLRQVVDRDLATRVYLEGPTPHRVLATTPNIIFSKLTIWCCILLYIFGVLQINVIFY